MMCMNWSQVLNYLIPPQTCLVDTSQEKLEKEAADLRALGDFDSIGKKERKHAQLEDPEEEAMFFIFKLFGIIQSACMCVQSQSNCLHSDDRWTIHDSTNWERTVCMSHVERSPQQIQIQAADGGDEANSASCRGRQRNEHLAKKYLMCKDHSHTYRVFDFGALATSV